MVFEDNSRAGGVGSRYLGEGFRQEADFREATATTFVPGTAAAPADGEATIPMAQRMPTPNLDYVFDDPDDGEPGRDRMLVHGLWELLLAVSVASAGYLLYREQPGAFAGSGFRALLLMITVAGAFGAAWAVALRAGMPNLAVGAVAAAASVYFAQHAGGGLAKPLLVVIGGCAVIGAVQGLVVVGLHVPSWAASLGVAATVFLWTNRQVALTIADGYDPRRHAYWWFGGLCALSVAAGLVSLFPTVRRTFGRFRPVADPAYRRGVVAALIAMGATVASAVLAGVAGVLGTALNGTVVPSDGLEFTVVGLGVALLGGTSAYGRRGGIFGTVLAAALLTLVLSYATALGYHWSVVGFAVVAIGLGLAVTRLVERFGRPFLGAGPEFDEEWAPQAEVTAEETWSVGTAAGIAVPPAPVARPWQAVEPTSSAGPGGIWTSDQAWGPSSRR